MGSASDDARRRITEAECDLSVTGEDALNSNVIGNAQRVTARRSATASLSSVRAVPEPRKTGKPRRKAIISRRVRPLGASDQGPSRS